MMSLIILADKLSGLSFYATVASIIFLTGPLFFVALLTRKARQAACVAIYLSSYGFALTLWLSSIVEVFRVWGGAALTFGLLFVGVGVVPMCLVAEAISSYWKDLGVTLFLIFCVFVPRILAFAAMMWLDGRDERTQADRLKSAF
jgi:hypothetical protein